MTGAKLGLLKMPDTVFIRFIAVLLITNSHLDGLYPDPRFGTGGALGNSLFFAASGYGLMMGWKAAPSAFLPWFKRRFMRIYPAAWVAGGILAFLAWQRGQVVDPLSTFVWPTAFWFVSAIILFYIPYYFLMRSASAKALRWTILLIVLPYVYFYVTGVDMTRWSIESDYFKWIFYFQIMLLGGLIAHASAGKQWSMSHYLVLLFASLVLYFGYKLLAGPLGLWKWQFLTHLFTVPIVWAAFRLSASEFVRRRIVESAAGPLVSLLAGLTLEIYMVQNLVYSNEFIKSLPFPFSVLAFALCAVLLAYIVQKAAALLSNLIEKLAGLSGRVAWGSETK